MKIPTFLVALLLCIAPALSQAEMHQHGSAKPAGSMVNKWAQTLARQQSLAVSVAFDADGRLWRAGVREGHVWVDRSDDAGKTYSTPVMVNAEAEAIGAEGDSRPKIATGNSGEVYVSWTRLLDKPYSGDVRFSRSLDGGKTFSAPLTVNDNREVISHRFDALAVGADGRIYLVWLDKRDAAAAKKSGTGYAGSALYHAVSSDGGASFSANAKLADHSCECCRIALTVPAAGAPVAFWRHVYDGNVRDHALVRLDGADTPRRVTHDEWKVDACPHHGPALSISAGNTYHLSWFDDAPQARGLFYARSTDEGKTYSPQIAVGNPAAQAGHASILSIASMVRIAWKEFDGETSSIYLMQSRDDGVSWSQPRRVAETRDASDHPQLAGNKSRAFLSWNTLQQGHRLIALENDAR